MRIVLVVGGCGFIGSYMAKVLFNEGYQVVILDNLSTGKILSARFGELVIGDLENRALLEDLFSQYKFDAVMHFAAASLVGESVTNPAKYYNNNVSNTLHLLDVMIKHGVMNLIFSSTAAIFGNPEYVPIDESHPKNPINPYGKSKLMIEEILDDYAEAYHLNAISLRYFNACGSDPEGDLGEMHDPETHLIPLVLKSALDPKGKVEIFGSDYPTDDGTCVRDYIHIVDLCEAHKISMNALFEGRLTGSKKFNLGNGNGFSVKEVVDTASLIVAKDNKKINVINSDRRVGDPAILISDSSMANQILGWSPRFSELKRMITDAWLWEKKINKV